MAFQLFQDFLELGPDATITFDLWISDSAIGYRLSAIGYSGTRTTHHISRSFTRS